MRRLRAGTVGMCLLLSACGAEDELAKCLSANEQTILLRQIALTGERKMAFDYCQQLWPSGENCRALYLDADTLVRTCMKGAGYTFINVDYYFAYGKSPYISALKWRLRWAAVY
jgi:hypothetical protein